MNDPDFEAAIVHDFENCRITCSIPNLVGKVQRRLSAIDRRYWVGPTRIYGGNASTFIDEADHLRIKSAGFKYYETPSRQFACDMCNRDQLDDYLVEETCQFNRNTDLADCVLIEETLGRALLGTLPPTVVMITTDKDFNIAMDHLYDGGYTLFSVRNILPGDIEVRRPGWANGGTMSWEALERNIGI